MGSVSLLATLLAAGMTTACGGVAGESSELDGATQSAALKTSPKTETAAAYAQVGVRPLNAASTELWASSPWPQWEDGINHRWQPGSDDLSKLPKDERRHSMSPAEKYDDAFNGWEPPDDFWSLRPMKKPGAMHDGAYYEKLGPAATWEHQNSGHWIARNGKDDDGDGKIDEDDGDGSWDGLESWWGHCNGWARASLLEREPHNPVTVNGVRFDVSDIKALLAEVYFGDKSTFAGARCERKKATFVTNFIKGCKDFNPGTLHLALTEIVGKQKQGIVIDTSSDYEVWNYPVYKYRINKQDEISKAGAVKALNLSGKNTKIFGAGTKRFVQVDVDLWVLEGQVPPGSKVTDDVLAKLITIQNLTYILEYDTRDEIRGSEWIGESVKTHPDFAWLPNGYSENGVVTKGNFVPYDDDANEDDDDNPHVRYSRVKRLAMESSAQDDEVFVEKHGSGAALPANGSIKTEARFAEGAAISDIAVSLDVGGVNLKNLSITLRAPGGQEVVLSDGDGKGSQIQGLVVPHRAAGNADGPKGLATFAGSQAQGIWTLTLTNRGDQAGVLKSWGILAVLANKRFSDTPGLCPCRTDDGDTLYAFCVDDTNCTECCGDITGKTAGGGSGVGQICTCLSSGDDSVYAFCPSEQSCGDCCGDIGGGEVGGGGGVGELCMCQSNGDDSVYAFCPSEQGCTDCCGSLGGNGNEVAGVSTPGLCSCPIEDGESLWAFCPDDSNCASCCGDIVTGALSPATYTSATKVSASGLLP